MPRASPPHRLAVLLVSALVTACSGAAEDVAQDPTSPEPISTRPVDVPASGADEPSPPDTLTPDSGASAEPTDGGQGVPDGGQTPGGPIPTPDGGSAPAMTFFVTSRGVGKGGDLRLADGQTGLEGADAFCRLLAAAVEPQLGLKRWRAYLSTSAVNARDRIGAGPWHNAKGVKIASSVAELHEENGLTNALSAASSLDEKGKPVPGAVRVGNATNVHDILTGSTADGKALAGLHCNDWTSSSGDARAQVGHSDRTGGGSTSWNSVHPTGGCAESGSRSVRTGGGRGSIYCFSAD